MAEYTPEQIAEANKISAWAADRDRQLVEARRAAYREALQHVVSDPAYMTVRDGLRDVAANAEADDNLSFHVAAILAGMDRLDIEVSAS
ncbi:MAG: hypothetical protein ACTMKV_02005 [Sphingomonas parapaucimobilis]